MPLIITNDPAALAWLCKAIAECVRGRGHTDGSDPKAPAVPAAEPTPAANPHSDLSHAATPAESPRVDPTPALAALQEAVRRADSIARSAQANVREAEGVARRQAETRAAAHRDYAAAVFAAAGPGGPDSLLVEGTGGRAYRVKRHDYGFGAGHFAVEQLAVRGND